MVSKDKYGRGSRMRGFSTPRKSFMESFKTENFGEWERVDTNEL